MAAAEGIKAGSQIAGYRVVDRIGRGGMAVVFRAHDERLGRIVALKVLAPVLADDKAFRQRFIRESRAAAAVDDPHIIPVFEAGDAGGVLFIAMRYVAGGDVRSLLRRAGPLPVMRAASIISPVAAALDAAHAAGLVHRDVKPANMLIDTGPGRPDHVYLSDFGLSKGALSSAGLTGSGLFLGTPDYVSPEQIAGRKVDGRADQYALACAAFEMLSGQPPFPRDHDIAVIYAHASEPPPALASRRPGSPAAADAVLAKALAKDPADRYGTCQEFGESLREAMGLGPYDIGAASSNEERSATVVVPRGTTSPDPDAGAEHVSGLATGMRDDEETLTVGAAPDGEMLMPAPGGVGVSARPDDTVNRAAPLAGVKASDESPDPDGQARQVPAGAGSLRASGSGPANKRRSRGLVLAAAGTVLVVAAVWAVVSLHQGPAAKEPHHHSARRASALVPMKPVPSGSLQAVIAGSGRTVWAIGSSGSGQPLIERWNGTTWSHVPAPAITDVNIYGAAAGPGGTAWAVGASSSCSSACSNSAFITSLRTLVLHWDGTTWSRIPAPSPRRGAILYSVAAEQDGTAWAVGCSPCINVTKTLILHWDGTSWSRFRNPGDTGLNGVAAGPGGTAWAVGSHIWHWNGSAWTRVPSPKARVLRAITVAPDGTAWAVGNDCAPCSGTQQRAQTVALHWDGARWSRVPSPSPAGIAELNSVSTGPGGTAWAAGPSCAPGCEYGYNDLQGHTLILRWDGSAWAQVPSPNPGHSDTLSAVAAGNNGSAWAAGQTCISQCNTSSAKYQTLILRWNGTAWVRG
jgi:serine/threonine-protein kinase